MKFIESVQRGIFKSLKWLKKASPTILTCAGAVGIGVTAVLTGKAVPKAIRLMEEAQNDKADELTAVEKVIAAAPAYIPAVVSGVVTAACVIGANLINKRQQAALTSAYILLDNMFKEYKTKVKDLYGDTADKEVREAIVKDKYDGKGISDDKILFYEPYYGEFFESTKEEVREAEYHLNRNFILRGYASLREFYEFLGLDTTEADEALGWSCDAGCEFYGYQWIDFEHELTAVDDDPELECFIIHFPFPPTADYI